MFQVNERVYIPEAGVNGIIIRHMAYGAVVKYTLGGIEFEEMLPEEDYELLSAGLLYGLSIDE